MSLVVEIKTDAALAPIAAYEAALGKVEAKGPAVGAALSQGFGNSSTAAEKAKQSTQSLTEQMAKLANSGSAFAGLSGFFQRQADIMDKIRGPAREYEADLQAIDDLLARGTITTNEYADQVTRMNQAIDGTKRAAEEASNPAEKLGSIFETLALPAAGAGILEIGHKIADVVEQMERMEDEFTNLENKVVRFVDASHTSNDLLDEQREVAEKLHVPMSSLLDVYDRVRVATDGLRLSHEEQIRIEQTLGAAMIVSGKSIDEAGGFMNRFAYAMESGSLGGGEFKRMMKEVPELGRQFSQTMNMSVDQIQHFIDEGKIGPRDLLNSMKNNFALIDADMAKRRVTNAQEIEAYTQQIKLLVGAGQGGTNAVAGAGLDQKGFEAQFLRNGFGASDAMDRQRAKDAIADIVKQGDAAVHLTGQFTKLGEARDKSMATFMNAFANAPILIDKVSASVGNLIVKLDDMGAHGADAWGKTDTAFGLGVKDSQDYAQKIGGAKKQLEALRLEVAAHAIGADDARKKYEALETTLNDGRLPAAIKIFDALHDPVRTHNEDLSATVALYKSATINAVDYQYELLQLRNTDPGFARLKALLEDDVKKYDEATAAAKRYADAAKLGIASPAAAGLIGPQFTQANRDALSDVSLITGLDKAGQDKQTELEKAYLDILNQGAGPVEKYYDALTKLNEVKSLMSDDEYAKHAQSLKEQFGASVAPAEKFRREIEEVNSLLHEHIITSDDAKKKLVELGKEQEKLADSGHDFASGFSRGWHAIRDEAQDTATTISTAMKTAFDDINANIVSMVTTGSADWGKLASTIEADFAKLALQKVEGSLFDAATGGAATGAAVGTTASTTMLASAGIVGTAIGAAAAGAMEAGSAISSAASSASMVAAAGLWTGGDVAIPRAANGYEGKVGGVAGVDTKLFATMVSPGETVSVRTEGQMAAQQRNAGGQGVTIVNKHDTRGELADGLSSGDYDTHVINILKRNAGAVQSILKK